jgi:hypothetical protein
MINFRSVAIAAVAIHLALRPAFANPSPDQDDLYKAETIVTGTGETERLRGFKIGAREVFIKLTGRPKLALTPQAEAVIARGPELIAEHSYEDRMKDIPIHDEQGTRDRPHFLRMRFDQQKFDQALKEAGIGKWDGKRPTVAVWLGIRETRGRYILTRDGDEGYGQREVLREASKRRAIPIVLPQDDQEAIDYADLVKNNWSALLSASKALGADAVLYGTLEFDGNAHWDCQWVIAGDSAYAKWKLKGVTFDTALKDAIDRVMISHAWHETYVKESVE